MAASSAERSRYKSPMALSGFSLLIFRMFPGLWKEKAGWMVHPSILAEKVSRELSFGKI